MAKIEINPALEKYLMELTRFEKDSPEIAKEIVMAGAQPLADEIRNGIESLPGDVFRRLTEGEEFSGLPSGSRKDLLNNFGIAPPGVDKNGNTNTKVGFKGYGSYPTKKYPKGLPNALLARAIESGSSVRKKSPFVRKAVNKKRKIAIEKMQEKIEEKIKIYAL